MAVLRSETEERRKRRGVEKESMEVGGEFEVWALPSFCARAC